MHFIQNSWFAVYSIWLLLLILGVVGIIAYMHNRQRFLRRIVACFSFTFLAALFFSFHSDRKFYIERNEISLTEVSNSDHEVEGPSILNNAFRFLGSIIRDKMPN